MYRNERKSMRWAALLCMLGMLAGAADAANGPRSPFNGRQSYSGSAMNCLIANDFYAVHFTAMQEGRKAGEKTDFEKYCQDIPFTGKLYLTVDLLDRDVRNTPISLRVVEETISDGHPPQIKTTLNEVAPKIYKNGSADTQVTIMQPGHYALIATIGEDAVTEDDRLRIPFSVGLPPPTDYGKLFGRLTGGLAFAFYAAFALIGYRVYRVYRPKTARAATAKSGVRAPFG